MFGGTAITAAPSLPATTLTDSCYYEMFRDCTRLSSVIVPFTNWNANKSSTKNWLGNVKSTGVFMCPAELGTQSTIARGTTYCPTNWTVSNWQGFYVQAQEADCVV